MKVLKVELEGLTSSFRYPHFIVGRQPSYPMPPPATIYGHVCSAAGRYIEPDFKFAYYFTYQGKGDDIETIYQTEVAKGNMVKKWGYSKNIEIQANPYLREIMLFPSLILYISSSEDFLSELYDFFRSPRYPVLLGRSQDLASYKSVKVIELQEKPVAYFEGTLLPGEYSMRTGVGISILMPKFIDPEDRRKVMWEKYIVLEKRVFLLDKKEERVNIMLRLNEEEKVWVDPETPEIKSMNRAVVWHSFKN